jgi:hypothetical protein
MARPDSGTTWRARWGIASGSSTPICHGAIGPNDRRVRVTGKANDAAPISRVRIVGLLAGKTVHSAQQQRALVSSS